MELKLLASLAKSREAYETVEHFLSSKDLSPMGAEILKDIIQFYENDEEATSVDLSVVKSRVSRRVRGDHIKDKLEQVIQDIDNSSVSPSNVAQELIAQKKEQIGHDLANAILSHDDKQVPFLLEDYQNIFAAEDLGVQTVEEYKGADLASVIREHFSDDARIKVSPRSLNDRLGGGLRRGHHVVVVALPETGKTLLSINIAAGAANKGNLVLYIGNEEPTRDLLVRGVSCLAGMSTDQVSDAPEEAESKARRKGYDNIIFAGLDPGSLWEINALVKKHRPDVLVVDQIRHVKARSENRTTQLEAVAQGIRNIARANNLLAISVTQGADSARNKLVLDMGDVDSSNVGIPGACDVMLMMGSNEDYRRSNARMLTLAKNKVSGLHDAWPISIIPEITRIVDQ